MEKSGKIKENVPLAPMTTFKLGGPARYYLEAADKSDIAAAYGWARRRSLAVHVLGGGSNILVPDAGVDGLVIRLANEQAEIIGERMECGAGLTLALAVKKCEQAGLSGLEWSSGIPRATIGGSIRGNAGAFGACMADLVESVEAYDIERGGFRLFGKSECAFGYRDSRFKRQGGLLVYQACLRFVPAAPAAIRQKIEHSIDFRARTYPSFPSAGSVFENMPAQEAKAQNPALFEQELKDKVNRTGKISAGLLIDLCGLKGKAIGGVMVSQEHANHVINFANGRAEDVVMLISYIKTQVRDRLGLQLREEIQYFGF